AARVTLATGAAAQLVVDAARLVALGADDLEAARVEHLLPLGLALLLELRGELDQALVLVERRLGRAAVGLRTLGAALDLLGLLDALRELRLLLGERILCHRL